MGGSQRLTSSRCYDLLKELFMPRVALEENCEGLSKFCILDPEGPVSSQVEMSPHLQVIVGEDDEEPRNVAGNQNIVLKPSSFTVAMALPKMQQRLNATVVFLASVALATRLYYHEASQSEFGRRMEDLRQKFEDQWSIQIDDRHGLGSRYLVTVRHLLGFLPFLQSGLLRESLTLGSHMLVGRSQILKLTSDPTGFLELGHSTGILDCGVFYCTLQKSLRYKLKQYLENPSNFSVSKQEQKLFLFLFRPTTDMPGLRLSSFDMALILRALLGQKKAYPMSIPLQTNPKATDKLEIETEDPNRIRALNAQTGLVFLMRYIDLAHPANRHDKHASKTFFNTLRRDAVDWLLADASLSAAKSQQAYQHRGRYPDRFSWRRKHTDTQSTAEGSTIGSTWEASETGDSRVSSSFPDSESVPSSERSIGNSTLNMEGQGGVGTNIAGSSRPSEVPKPNTMRPEEKRRLRRRSVRNSHKKGDDQDSFVGMSGSASCAGARDPQIESSFMNDHAMPSSSRVPRKRNANAIRSPNEWLDDPADVPNVETTDRAAAPNVSSRQSDSVYDSQGVP
eukprot:GHVT01097069.1.p1 GENE.GHVT01097069.1~~GHVT01097069.1.p1  ORF type:complete len:565 (+),score=41.56 GHVT01097069.1:1035-2729(+)